VVARRIAWGKFMNAGQVCISPDYVLCVKDVHEKLVEEFKKALFEFFGSDPSTSSDYSRIVNQRHFNRLKALIPEPGSNEKIVYGGQTDEKSLYIAPTIVDQVDPNSKLMKDEIFGPLLPILVVQDISEAIRFIRSRPKPLALYLFSNSAEVVQRFKTETSSGALTINDTILHALISSLPFGGVGASGFGAYHGKFGFEQFSHKRSILKRGFFGESLAACRYAPMTDKKFAQLQQLSTRRALPRWLQALLREWKGALLIFVLGILLGVYGRK